MKMTLLRRAKCRLEIVGVIQACAGILIVAGLSYAAGCSSGGSDQGRFVVEKEQPAPGNKVAAQAEPSIQSTNAGGANPTAEAGSATPVPGASLPSSSSPLEDVMQQAENRSSESVADSMATGKRYLQMSEEEKYDFVEQRARHVSRMIGSGTYEFSRQSIGYIKQYVDAYARRVGNGSKATWGEDLNVVFARAQRFAPVIIRSFNARRIPPAIGLYLVARPTAVGSFLRKQMSGRGDR